MIQNKKLLLIGIPMSICNFRCHYCYLAQRPVSYQGIQPEMKYTPEQVARALTPERIGGNAFMNFCAEGETLLTRDIDRYIKALVELGHYAEIVTNLTVTQMIDRILSWESSLLKRVEFKCSFHYLELKKRGLLEVFVKNVHKIWEAGASATIEVTPSDELIPYIEELKTFSMKHFGALPHFTIARDDRVKEIKKLTALSDDEYERTWSQFDSDFWAYKQTIFGKKQTGFCYAGAWSLVINLATGQASRCYFGGPVGNVFADPERPLPESPIGRCWISHCYNGHALMTMGLIPGATDVGFGDIRNRVRTDGQEWLQPELKAFFNSKLVDSNREYTQAQKNMALLRNSILKTASLPIRTMRKIYKRVFK